MEIFDNDDNINNKNILQGTSVDYSKLDMDGDIQEYVNLDTKNNNEESSDDNIINLLLVSTQKDEIPSTREVADENLSEKTVNESPIDKTVSADEAPLDKNVSDNEAPLDETASDNEDPLDETASANEAPLDETLSKNVPVDDLSDHHNIVPINDDSINDHITKEHKNNDAQLSDAQLSDAQLSDAIGSEDLLGKNLLEAGFDGVLVGSALMQSDNPEQFIQTLRGCEYAKSD